MSHWRRAASGAVGILLSLTMLVTDTAAAGRTLFELLDFPSGRHFETERRAGNVGRQSQGRKVRLDAKYTRQVVSIDSDEPAGTIIVMTRKKFLYFVLGNGKAIRYGIGTARDGFEWSGTHRVTAKREWPGWSPPAAMKKRKPELPDYMPGGIDNPLGARALYIGSTLYRIHGTNEPWSIGQDVSSGCIRMINDDVIDLYERVKIGAKVIVL
jgi:lipoprotein-anchoring transpeptidase ErfK/SrfK